MVDKKDIFPFIAAFKQDSAFLINNFLRKHTHQQYTNGEFNNFDFVTGGLDFGNWNNPEVDFSIMEYITNSKSAYWKVDKTYLTLLVEFAEYLAQQSPISESMTVYRGCNSLEIDGVSGVVSTTRDKRIAEQFDRGTILKINLPKGMKFISVDKLRPGRKSVDREQEIILPPCDYTVKAQEMRTDFSRPNNDTGETKFIEIDVQPRDLLRDFLISMGNPVEDYVSEIGIDAEYKYVYMILTIYLFNRTLSRMISTSEGRGTGLYGKTDAAKRDDRTRLKDTNMQRAWSLLNSNEDIPNMLLQKMRSKISNYGELPPQLSAKQLFDYIKASKSREVFYEYVDSKEHEHYYKFQSHGSTHANNVSLFAYYIAAKEGYTPEGIRVLMEAARYHDIGRTNDWEEGGHGYGGAVKYATDHQIIIPTYEQQLIGFLIQAHDLPRVKDIRILASEKFKGFQLNEKELGTLCDMANILRDADALDRTRFALELPEYLDPRYLTHNSSKEIIEAAQTLNYRQRAHSKRTQGDIGWEGTRP